MQLFSYNLNYNVLNKFTLVQFYCVHLITDLTKQDDIVV